jgi:lipoprotein-releasing system ATP-binding protein
MSEMQAVIIAESLSKSYIEAKHTLEIFRDLNFVLEPGESVAIVGSSGAGKTTLLNMLAGLDSPNTGKVTVCGHNLSGLSELKLAQVRNQYLGFVYQFHHLLPEFSALENVAMPLYIAGQRKHPAQEKALHLLEQVGLGARVTHKPAELSGGERQRVAIARALVNEPKCVLMDEPTGNLDEATARKIHAVMVQLKEAVNTSFVVVTHDHQLAGLMDRTLLLENGALHSPG